MFREKYPVNLHVECDFQEKWVTNLIFIGFRVQLYQVDIGQSINVLCVYLCPVIKMPVTQKCYAQETDRRSWSTTHMYLPPTSTCCPFAANWISIAINRSFPRRSRRSSHKYFLSWLHIHRVASTSSKGWTHLPPTIIRYTEISLCIRILIN